MAKKSAKAAVDTKQVPGAAGLEGSENRNPPADIQQEVPTEEIPDVQQVQQPSPDLGMKMSEIMHPPEEAQEGLGGSADAGVQQPFPNLGMKVPEIMHPPEEAQEGTGGSVDAGAKQSPTDLKDGQQEEQIGQTGQQRVTTFRITCRNKVSKVIGGVSFVNGVGYTNDGFTASWFGNKDGYDVKKAGT